MLAYKHSFFVPYNITCINVKNLTGKNKIMGSISYLFLRLSISGWNPCISYQRRWIKRTLIGLTKYFIFIVGTVDKFMLIVIMISKAVANLFIYMSGICVEVQTKRRLSYYRCKNYLNWGWKRQNYGVDFVSLFTCWNECNSLWLGNSTFNLSSLILQQLS